MLETTHLQQMMVVMVKSNPELAKSTPSDILTSNRGSMYEMSGPPSAGGRGAASRHPSVSSRQSLYAVGQTDDLHGEDDDDVEAGINFTYIPPNPKKFYIRRRSIHRRLEESLLFSSHVGDE